MLHPTDSDHPEKPILYKNISYWCEKHSTQILKKTNQFTIIDLVFFNMRIVLNVHVFALKDLESPLTKQTSTLRIFAAVLKKKMVL